MKLDERLGYEVMETIHRRDTLDNINYNFAHYCRIIKQLDIMKKDYDKNLFNQVTNIYLEWKKKN
ncbi:MAG: hypothetical protein ACOC5T_03880 [Elusimicrobiota bacterium]